MPGMKTSKKKLRVRQPRASERELETQGQNDVPLPDKIEVPKPNPLPEYDQKFNPIHEHILKTDPKSEWEEISKWISQTPRNAEQAINMLSEQADMLMRASRLYILAKREYERFELAWKKETGVMRDLARDYWEIKKREGMRKQITNDMVDDFIIEHWGDTYTEMYMRLQDMKNTKELIEKMCAKVEDVAADCRRMIDRYSGKNPAPSWMTGQKKNRSR